MTRLTPFTATVSPKRLTTFSRRISPDCCTIVSRRHGVAPVCPSLLGRQRPRIDKFYPVGREVGDVSGDDSHLVVQRHRRDLGVAEADSPAEPPGLGYEARVDRCGILVER